MRRGLVQVLLFLLGAPAEATTVAVTVATPRDVTPIELAARWDKSRNRPRM